MPSLLRQTVARSFRGRVAGDPEFARALDNGFWGRDPATPWEALDAFALEDLNAMTVVYERVIAKLPALWLHLKCIDNLWYGTSFGFHCVWDDQAATENLLAADPRVARDLPLGAAEHQSEQSPLLIRMFNDEDCHCWRELDCTGAEGFHVTIAASLHGFDGIHVDWIDPADGRTPEGFCTYAADACVDHLIQVLGRRGDPPSPFSLDLDARAARIDRLRASNVDPLLDEAQAALDGLSAEWGAKARVFAVTGISGRAAAHGFCDMVGRRVDSILDWVDPPRPGT